MIKSKIETSLTEMKTPAYYHVCKCDGKFAILSLSGEIYEIDSSYNFEDVVNISGSSMFMGIKDVAGVKERYLISNKGEVLLSIKNVRVINELRSLNGKVRVLSSSEKNSFLFDENCKPIIQGFKMHKVQSDDGKVYFARSDENLKFKLYDEDGNLVLNNEVDSIKSIIGDIVVCFLDSKMGAINIKTGAIVAPFKHSDVQVDGKFIIATNKGNVELLKQINQKKYDDFIEENGKITEFVYNEFGDLIMSSEYEVVDSICETNLITRMTLANTFGLRNLNGELVVPHSYAFIRKVEDYSGLFEAICDDQDNILYDSFGRRIFKNIENSDGSITCYYLNKDDTKRTIYYGLSFASGEFLKPVYTGFKVIAEDKLFAERDGVVEIFNLKSGELLYTYENASLICSDSDRVAVKFISSEGKSTIYVYDENFNIFDLSDYDDVNFWGGIKCETILCSVEKNGLFGAVNNLGEEVVPPIYDTYLNFSKSGYCAVNKKRNIGVIFKTGEVILPPANDNNFNFLSDDFISVKKGDFMIYNKEGKKIASYSYDEYHDIGAYSISELALVDLFIRDNDGRITKKTEILNINGKKTEIPNFRLVTKSSIYDEFIFESNGKKGVLSKNGDIIIPAEYDMIIFDKKHNIYEVMTNPNIFGAFDANGKPILNCSYSEVVKDYLNFGIIAGSYSLSDGFFRFRTDFFNTETGKYLFSFRENMDNLRNEEKDSVMHTMSGRKVLFDPKLGARTGDYADLIKTNSGCLFAREWEYGKYGLVYLWWYPSF